MSGLFGGRGGVTTPIIPDILENAYRQAGNAMAYGAQKLPLSDFFEMPSQQFADLTPSELRAIGAVGDMYNPSQSNEDAASIARSLGNPGAWGGVDLSTIGVPAGQNSNGGPRGGVDWGRSVPPELMRAGGGGGNTRIAPMGRQQGDAATKAATVYVNGGRMGRENDNFGGSTGGGAAGNNEAGGGNSENEGNGFWRSGRMEWAPGERPVSDGGGYHPPLNIGGGGGSGGGGNGGGNGGGYGSGNGGGGNSGGPVNTTSAPRIGRWDQNFGAAMDDNAAIQAVKDNLNATILPEVQSNMAAMGLSRSGASNTATANAITSAMVPVTQAVMQAELQNKGMDVGQRSTDIGAALSQGQQALTARGQDIGSREAAMSGLSGIDSQELNRTLAAINADSTLGGRERSIYDARSGADYAELMRQFGLSHDYVFAPFTGASNMIGSRTESHK